jgi:hypothetical protein
MTVCEACTRGDHGNCGLQSWCECNDPRDGCDDAEPDWTIEDEEEEE